MRARSHATAGQRELGLDRAVGIGRRAARRPPAPAPARAARRVAVEHEPAAQPAAREVQHVVDQPGHPRDAARASAPTMVDAPCSSSGVCCSSRAPASIEASGLRRSWPSTAMNCSRSSAVWRSSSSAASLRRQPLVRVEMEGDQLGEQLEHADRSPGCFSLRRPRIDRAQRAEELAVGQQDRHRDVALEAVHRRRVVAAELGSSATWSITTASRAARISSQIVVSTLSSPPGFSPKAISSRTAQAIQRSSVTRATAAKPMPVVRQTTSRIVGTASMPAMADRSALMSVTESGSLSARSRRTISKRARVHDQRRIAGRNQCLLT